MCSIPMPTWETLRIALRNGSAGETCVQPPLFLVRSLLSLTLLLPPPQSKPDWQGVCGIAPDSGQLEEAVATKDLYM